MRSMISGAVFLVVLTAGMAQAADNSCRHTAGAKQAAALVAQCREVSESSRWPCSAAKTCAQIEDAIRKGCGDLNYGQPVIEPKFCRAYIGRRR
jgi:hypothetical protein